MRRRATTSADVKPDGDAGVVPKWPPTPSGLSVLPPDHLRVLPPDPRRVLPGGGVGVVPVHPPRVLPGGGVGVIPVDPKGVVPKSTTFRRRFSGRGTSAAASALGETRKEITKMNKNSSRSLNTASRH